MSGCSGSFIGVVTSSSTQNAGACKLPADVGLGGLGRASVGVPDGGGVDGGDAVFPSSTRLPREEDGLSDFARRLEEGVEAGGGSAGAASWTTQATQTVGAAWGVGGDLALSASAGGVGGV